MAFPDDLDKKQLIELLEGARSLLGTVFMLSYLLAFSLLAVVDATKAFSKRAHWVPGNALVLSAFTIQVLGFVSTEDEPDGYFFGFLIRFQLIVEGGRLSMCIFIGYVLPRMGACGSLKDLHLITALLLSIFSGIMSELYYVYWAEDDRKIRKYIQERDNHAYVYWFKLSTYILSISMIFLLSASTSAVIASKTVHRLLKQRIALILPTANVSVKKHTWMNFEDEVFKSWVLTRVAQPDYVMARSVLNSAAALVVTLCTLFSVFKTLWIMYHYGESFNTFFSVEYDGYTQSWILLEVCAVRSFLIIVCVIICWRWTTTVFFFPKLKRIGRFFCVEDFWINSIIELKHVCDTKSLHLQRHSKSDTDFISLLICKMRLQNLLYALSAFQISVVFICKGVHLLSEMVFMLFQFIINLFLDVVRMLLQFIIKSLLVRIRVIRALDLVIKQRPVQISVPCNQRVYSSRFEDFEDILERMCMPGEDPEFLWKANSSAINKIEKLMKEARQKGKDNKFVKSNFAQFSGQWILKGFELLAKLNNISSPEVNRYFPYMNNTCSKLTAVSLLNVLVQLDAENSRHIMDSMRDVWDMLSFADDSNIEADDEYAHQLSMAADEEFHRIQKDYGKSHISSHSHAARVQVQFLENQLNQTEKLLKDDHLLPRSGEENASCENSVLHDSMEWMKIAPQYSLYKVLQVMKRENLDDPIALIAWSESSLRFIIAACLSKLPNIISQYAKKCAEEFNENSLWNTAYITGKTRGVCESFELHPLLEMKGRDEMEWRVESVVAVSSTEETLGL